MFTSNAEKAYELTDSVCFCTVVTRYSEFCICKLYKSATELSSFRSYFTDISHLNAQDFIQYVK